MFSPKRAIAPAFFASSSFISWVWTGASPLRDAGDNIVLDGEDLFRRERPFVREVETELILFDLRGAALRGRFARFLRRRKVQQVRGRVGPPDGRAALAVDLGVQLLADLQAAPLEMADVQDQAAVALRVDHVEFSAVRGEHADVAHLAARLAIKGRAIEHDADCCRAADFFELIDELLFGDDADDFALRLELVVA